MACDIGAGKGGSEEGRHREGVGGRSDEREALGKVLRNISLFFKRELRRSQGFCCCTRFICLGAIL